MLFTYFTLLVPEGRWNKEGFLSNYFGFDPWVGKILWRRERLPTSVFCSGAFYGRYSLWVHKESDTTEQLSLIDML